MTIAKPDLDSVAAPVVPIVSTKLRPLGLSEVALGPGFWGDRQELNATSIIPHCLHWEDSVGWFDNFDAVLEGTIAETRTGREFSDSDVYKLLEAIAWELGRQSNPALQQRFDSLVARIGAVQREDGYLNTKFGNPQQDDRYTDLEWGHELYNFGHLIQAAVARLRTGCDESDALVAIALKAADHVCDAFGEGGIKRVCGHPEIEVALVELYRATGDPRYLTQAQLFLDRRGHQTLADIEFGRSYFQDDQPIREAEVLRGHAVRALYLTAAAIDVALETGEDRLFDAVHGQYHRALARRTYITGGMGSHHQDEAFGDDFELPPDRAYCETCAGIGSVMVAWRLLLATGDLSYGDVIERALYNVVATSPAEDGRAFFYTNTLHQRTEGAEAASDKVSPRALGLSRAPWFEVSCCPTNVARTFAQFGTYIATASERGVQLIQYATGRIEVSLPTGGCVVLDVTTDYPHDGRIRIEVVDSPNTPWELTLRVPAWAVGATVDVNDGRGPHAAAAPAFVCDSGLGPGAVIDLVLPLAPRYVYADERIDAVRGCVAIERGPLVLCAESIDQRADVAAIVIDTSAPLTATPEGGALTWGWLRELSEPAATPYSATPQDASMRQSAITLVPYHQWGQRGPGTMRIWLPEGRAGG